MDERVVKVVLLGDASVGKTSLVKCWQGVRDFAPGCPSPTIGSGFLTTGAGSGRDRVVLRVWDTAGDERYGAIIPIYVRDSQVVLLVLDVTRATTAANLVDRWMIVKEDYAPDAACIVVANKCDLDRTVDAQTVATIAARLGARASFETSVITTQNVDDLFAEVARCPSVPMPMDNHARPGAPAMAPKARGCCG